jgi:D-alanyl-D-alanine-carboxypeptidase/D-alanyl-D-alanine-endopeptidase
MQGHDFDGSPLPMVPTSPMAVGSGGLYSSTHDILRWMAWHLDRTDATGAEVRLLDHAAYVARDGLRPVSGLDESGHMDAMGLGWIIMRPEGSRPLILQKAGGLQGVFTYTAFSPTRGIGVFIAISRFNFSAAMTMAKEANDLISELSPR